MKQIKSKIINYYDLDQRERQAWKDLEVALYEKNIKMCIKYSMYLNWIEKKKIIRFKESDQS